MIRKIRAIYRDGVFQPESPCDLPELAEVELVIHESRTQPPQITDPAERRKVLDRLTARMRNNPLPANVSVPRRDELHERR